jgi:hypothetical protein
MPIKVLVGALLLWCAVGKACSCQPIDVKMALRVYDHVFSGKVSEVKYVDNPNGSSPRVVVRFRVFQIWKGEVTPTITMQTRRRDAGCEGLVRLQIRPGQKLLVYAIRISSHEWHDSEILTTDICSRTQLFAEASDDLRSLGVPFATY